MNTKIFLLFVLVVGCQLLSVAQPANDDPCNASLLGLSSSCNSMTFTTSAATNTAGVTAPGCANYAGGDVWFRFTMPDNGYHVVLEMEAADITAGGMAVYSGSACGSLTLVACDDGSSSMNGMPRLKVDDGCNFANAGDTYWVRVWEDGNDVAGNFGICAYTEAPDALAGVSTCGIYPPAGNSCCDAVLLSDLLDGYCGNSGGYNDVPISIPGFCAQIENNSWLAFRASDTNVSIELFISACNQGTGLQAGIFQTTDCASFSQVSNCSNIPNYTIQNTDTLNATGLTIGETYYLMIDGWSMDSCDYSLRVLNGVEMTTVSVSDDVICTGETITLQANTTGIGPYTYAWSPASSLNDSTLQNPTASPASSTDYSVTITDANGSTAYSVSVLVYPNVPGTASIIGDTMLCEGVTTTFTASATEAANYTWSVSGGVSSNASGSSISVDWTTAGDYSLCVTPDNECGNGAQICRTVHVIAPPDISATSPAPICFPNTFDASSLSISNNSPTTGTEVETYYDNATDAAAGTNPLSSTTISSSGTYWVRMENLPGCFDIATFDVVIENPQISITDPARTCQPQTIDLATVIVSESNSLSGTRSYFVDSTDAVNNSNVLSGSTVSTSGRYFIRYETGNGCFDVGGVQVTIDTVPMVSTVGPLFVCQGEQVDLDTITLNDSNNATIVTKNFFTTKFLADLNLFPEAITIVSAGTYFVRVETAFGCFDVDSIIINESPAATGTISGGVTVCPGDSADLIFNFVGVGPFSGIYSDGSSSYNFTNLSNSDQIRVAVNANTTYSLVSFVDGSGCSGSVTGSSVNMQVHPVPTAVISGTAEICQGQLTDLTFNFTGSGPYDIVYTDGTNNISLTGLNSGDTETVNPITNTTYSLVSVNDANSCAGSVSGSASITLVDTVEVSNLNFTCDAQKLNYTVSFQIMNGDVGSYLVTGNSGTLIGNTFTSDPISSGSPYSFTVGDATACPSVVVSGVHDCSCVTDAGSMNLTLVEVCEGGSITTTHNADETLDVGDLLQYAVHTSAVDTLGQVFGISNGPTFNLLPGMNLDQEYYISAIAGPDNGSGQVDTNHICLDVSIGTPIRFNASPTATIAGGGMLCAGVELPLTFNFTGNGPFDIVFSDGTSNFPLTDLTSGDVEMVSPLSNTTYTLVSVIDRNNCSGATSGSAVMMVSDTVEVINIDISCDPQKLNYTVSFQIVNGDPMSYLVTGNSGTLVGNTFTSDPIPSGSPYSFTVGDATSCPSVIVNGAHDCSCITSAGTMNLNTVEACEGNSVTAVHNVDQTLETGDLLQYVIHNSAGDSLGQVYGINNLPTFGLQPGMNLNEVYYISAIAGPDNGSGEVDTNHICLDVSLGTPVRFNATPVAIISGGGTICEGDSLALTINVSAGIPPFDIVYTDGSSQVTLEDITDGYQFFVNPVADRSYSLISVVDNTVASCVGNVSGNASIQVVNSLEASQADIECNNTSTAFRVVVQLSGGDPGSTMVNGGTGSYDALTHRFTSDWMPNGTNYSFSFTDANNCDPAIVLGTHVCDCITASGTMATDLIEVCGAGEAIASYNNDGAEDGDDVRAYYLHDQSGTTLGTIMGVSNTPVFTFTPGMTYGTTYYISTVVGNDDGSGRPDLGVGVDRCLSVSEGQPVEFYPTPSVSVDGGTTICQGDTAYLSLALTGIAPFTVSYSDGVDTITVTNLQDGAQLAVDPQTTTTYQIIEVIGADPVQCPGEIDPINGQVTIEVIERPQINNLQVVCNATSTAYQIVFDISGGNSSTYTIAGDTNLVINAGVEFRSPWYISGAAYLLTIDDGGACPLLQLSATEYCLCTPDIQANIEVIQGISCTGDADARLMGTNINGQAPFQFSWSNGETDTLISDLGPGWYWVTMTDDNNCESIDSILIEDPLPIEANVVTRDPDCSGRPNGQIQLVDINGGAGQYNYYIDGQFSSTGRVFNNLEAGIPYLVSIEDVNGCIWDDTVTLNEPEPFTVEIGNDTSIVLGDSLLLQIQPSGPIDTFIWEPEQIYPCVNCSEMVVKPEFSVTYSVRVIKAGGLCEATDQFRVTVNREVPIYVPNVFSPNGDFKNERFTIYGGTGVERVAVMRIFSRWGELVYENTDFAPGSEDLGWDGRKGIEELPTGVYIYYAEVILSDGSRERVEGDVTLVR